jgi:spore germination cell wall hydrolase CwlJ-like protein
LLRPRIEVDAFASGGSCFRNAKRGCAIFGVIALTICALDLMNVHLVKVVGEYLNEDHQRRIAMLVVSPSEVIAATRDRQVAAQQSTPLQLASFNPNELPTLGMVPAPFAPRAALGAALPSPGELLHLAGTSMANAQRCLASAIYFEARAEPSRGQSAVAQVIMNRVFSGRYPSDICDVVYQKAHQRCQFSFACSAKSHVINERSAWARANRIAAQMLAGGMYDPALGTSTHFHASNINPGWMHEMRKIVRYGSHSFYRPIAWGSAAKYPVWANQTAQNRAGN